MTTKKTTTITEEATDTAASTEVIEMAESNEDSLNKVLHLDRRFASAARRGAADVTVRRLTWLTGNNDCLAANGKTPLESARGWFIDKPDEDELLPDDFALIDAMQVLCERGLARECVVVHQDENGKPKRVPSWKIMIASLYVVCEGCPTKEEMDADIGERWGVAYTGWRAGEKSQLLCSAFVKELADAGCTDLFAISFSSYLVDKFLACLRVQHRYVLPFAEALRLKAGESDELAYYSYAIPVQCSMKTLTAGKIQGKTKELYYPVPALPRMSTAYLASVAISDELAELLEDNGRVERTVEWSVERSKALLTRGSDTGDEAPGGYVGVDADGNPIDIPESLR